MLAHFYLVLSLFLCFSSGTSFCKLSIEFNVPNTILQRHAAQQNKGKTLNSREQHSVFRESTALEPKGCIVDLVELGFAPKVNDVRKIVTDYVNVNNHDRGKKMFNYKGLKGCRGPDWLKTFIKKQNLSLKNATKLCKARYNATKNPFIVNHRFNSLEETVKKLGIKDRQDLIWNSDESGLSSEPRKCKVISLTGRKLCKL